MRASCRVNGRSGLVAIDLATRKPGHVDDGQRERHRVVRVGQRRSPRVHRDRPRRSATGAQRGTRTLHGQARRQRVPASLSRPHRGDLRNVRSCGRCTMAPASTIAHRRQRRQPALSATSTGSTRETGRRALRLARQAGRRRALARRPPGRRAYRGHRGRHRRWRTYLARERVRAVDMLAGVHAARCHVMPVAFDGDGSLVVATRAAQRPARRCIGSIPRRRSWASSLAAHPQVDLSGGLIYDRRKERDRRRAITTPSGRTWHGSTRTGRALRRASTGAAGPFQRAVARRRAERAGLFLLGYATPARTTCSTRAAQARAPRERPRRHQAGRDAGAQARALSPRATACRFPRGLRLPKTRKRRTCPLVVYVHGGPWVRGATWAWHDVAAYLATLGYAVLRARVPRQPRLGLEAAIARLRSSGAARCRTTSTTAWTGS